MGPRASELHQRRQDRPHHSERRNCEKAGSHSRRNRNLPRACSKRTQEARSRLKRSPVAHPPLGPEPSARASTNHRRLRRATFEKSAIHSAHSHRNVANGLMEPDSLVALYSSIHDFFPRSFGNESLGRRASRRRGCDVQAWNGWRQESQSVRNSSISWARPSCERQDRTGERTVSFPRRPTGLGARGFRLLARSGARGSLAAPSHGARRPRSDGLLAPLHPRRARPGLSPTPPPWRAAAGCAGPRPRSCRANRSPCAPS